MSGDVLERWGTCVRFPCIVWPQSLTSTISLVPSAGPQFGLRPGSAKGQQHTYSLRMRQMPVPRSVPMDSVKSFLGLPKMLLIGGDWMPADSGKTFDVFDPATGQVIAQAAEADASDVDKAVAAARAAFEQGPWSRMSAAERGKLIWRVGELIEEHLDELAELDTIDNGMPLSLAKAILLPNAVEIFRYMAGWATKIEGSTVSVSVPYRPGVDYHAYTLREPVGVVGQIIPWNAPTMMAAWKLAPALACGCTVVLKVAEQTPLSALRLGELLMEAGIPDGVVNIITGYGETAGAALAAHPGVDKVAFTGSTEVGQSILRSAAGNLKKVTLELGGKSPNVIFKDADLSVAIPTAANAVFAFQGQVCCAGTRLFVQREVFDEVTAGVAEVAKSLKLGNGFQPDTAMGPLVSADQLARVTGFLERGRADGANVLCGGDLPASPGYFINPTVLVDTDDEMEVVREEIFGPIVTAVPFDDINDVTYRCNKTRYGLAAGVWTKDVKQAHNLARGLRVGTVWINSYYVFDPALPFGGYKQSGWGREMGHEVLNNYLETKSVCLEL